MKPHETAAALERYDRRLAEYGVTEKALGWGDKGRSRIRFEVLISHWMLPGSSVLDVGCGFGDLLGYMRWKNVEPASYLGVDINPNLIAIARERYPSGRFLVADIEDAGFNERHDFVLSSGVFNHRMDDNAAFIGSMLERFDALSTEGFAMNFLSNRVQFELENTYHADPCGILDLAYRYSNNVVLRNDYMPFEFTVFVNKRSQIDAALTVYEEFVKYER
jgi:SAM-dependent methyltransferase